MNNISINSPEPNKTKYFYITSSNRTSIGNKMSEFVQEKVIEISLINKTENELVFNYKLMAQNMQGTAKIHSWTADMDDLQSDLRNKKQGVNIVCCPMHAEPMVLQKKKNGIGLLDQYYLRCPHWAPNDQGCPYTEKLKSGSQLAALLKHQTGTGIL